MTFSGRMRSGKDMLCRAMETAYGAKTFSMATHLKILCSKILEMEIPCLSPWDNPKLDMWKNNRGVLLEEGIELCDESVKFISDYTGFALEDVKCVCSGVAFRNVRELLQLVGTDVIRSIDSSWHIKKTQQDISKLPDGTVACVDDIRFQNELDAFRNAGAESFFIIRTNAEMVSNHESEDTLHVSDFPDNRVIVNNGTPNELCKEFTCEFANGFNVVCDKPIFLSEYPKYCDVEQRFGLEQTPLVDEIIRQNRDRETFLKDGLITFRNNKNFNVKEVLEEMKITHSYSYEQIGGRFVIDNPVAYENLKRWL